MRAREMSLEDYGVPIEDQGKLREYCKNAGKEDRVLLLQTAISSACGLEICIYDSLVTGKGYDVINRQRYIPAKKDDFYAYKRKTMAKYYEMLKLTGRWKY